MKWITLMLFVLLVMLQARLWFGKNSISDFFEMHQQVEDQAEHNAALKLRNNLLKADIKDLTTGLDAIEERARNELGLIKQGETFYRILPSED